MREIVNNEVGCQTSNNKQRVISKLNGQFLNEEVFIYQKISDTFL